MGSEESKYLRVVSLMTASWTHWDVVPGEVCVLLEQLVQRGSQGGQARDEGTEVHDQASELLEFGDVCWHW